MKKQRETQKILIKVPKVIKKNRIPLPLIVHVYPTKNRTMTDGNPKTIPQEIPIRHDQNQHRKIGVKVALGVFETGHR